LVNPFAQAKLAMLGYAPVLDNPSVTSFSGPTTAGWWSQYINEAKINREQRHKLKQMREELWKIDHDLRQERISLDKSIKEFYLHKLRVIPNYPVFRPDQTQPPSLHSTPKSTNNSPNHSDPNTTQSSDYTSTSASASASSSPPFEINTTSRPAPLQDNSNIDVSDIIELSRKLNALKKNFCAQRNLMLNAFARLGQLLTPRQQAMLLVRIHIHTRFDGSNMELLKNVWQSVTSSEAPSVLSLLSMLPNGQQPSLLGLPGLSPPTTTIPAKLPTEPPLQMLPAVLAPHTIAALANSSNITPPMTQT